ncbi:MAG: hypothetical protein KGZ79_10310 [Dethiobacter sp.]|nr:hypothetical protein [Dethiobacter sp.]
MNKSFMLEYMSKDAITAVLRQQDRDIGIDILMDATPKKGQPELLSFLRKAKG